MKYKWISIRLFPEEPSREEIRGFKAAGFYARRPKIYKRPVHRGGGVQSKYRNKMIAGYSDKGARICAVCGARYFVRKRFFSPEERTALKGACFNCLKKRGKEKQNYVYDKGKAAEQQKK